MVVVIVVICLIVLITFSACKLSGDWDRWEDERHNNSRFALKETYWFIKVDAKGNSQKHYMYYYTEFDTYDRLLEQLQTAVFNKRFVSAQVERIKHGN